MDNMPCYSDFYRRVLSDLMEKGLVKSHMSVLVVCGGETDKNILQQLDFKDVTISNLDTRTTAEEMTPYRWSLQDAESLAFPDNSFDLVIVCAGLHHCHSPHRALLEMYRVARSCAVAIEARDGLLLRAAVRMGVADEYELGAVVDNDYAFGGLRGGSVPNYVYRWTEREVFKTIASYAPYSAPNIHWYHGFVPPIANIKRQKSPKEWLMMYALFPALWVFTKLFKRQGNQFAFAIVKPELPKEMFPWLESQGGEMRISRTWLDTHF
jgi:ubiquinone/menaquinone biosynthesis C-methylase UbiE